jgi:HEAT repeat protein
MCEAARLRRRWIIGLGVLTLFLLAVSLVFWPRSEGPPYQGKAISAWAFQLLAPGPEVREQAAAAFRHHGTNAVPSLIRMLETRDPLWRRQLWSWALRLPPRFRHGLLQHSPVPQEQAVHQAAAMALAIIGPDAKAAAPALGRALVSKDPVNLWQYADALGAIGKDSLPALTNALVNSDPNVRSAAIFGLGKLGADAEPAVLPLLQRLADNQADVRERAVQALSAIGPPAVPALVHAVEQERGLVRKGATEALMASSPSWRQVEPALIGMLQDPDPEVRSTAARTLGKIGPPARAAEPALAELAKDPDPAVSSVAKEALLRIHPEPAKGRGK